MGRRLGKQQLKINFLTLQLRVSWLKRWRLEGVMALIIFTNPFYFVQQSPGWHVIMDTTTYGGGWEPWERIWRNIIQIPPHSTLQLTLLWSSNTKYAQYGSRLVSALGVSFLSQTQSEAEISVRHQIWEISCQSFFPIIAELNTMSVSLLARPIQETLLLRQGASVAFSGLANGMYGVGVWFIPQYSAKYGV